MTTLGVILAGGQSRRMGGGDKFLRTIAGLPMLDHTLARLTPQVDHVILSANGNAQSLAAYALPIVEDGAHAGMGPLAGILAALRQAEDFGAAILISMPADTPFFPPDLVTRLTAAISDGGADVAVAASQGQSHHAIAAWTARIADPLEDWLKRSDTFAIREFLHLCRTATVDFPVAPHDPFFNINTPGDLEAARSIGSRLQPFSATSI